MTIFSSPFRRPALLLLGLATSLAACEPKLDTAPTPSKGSADFTRYVAVGNSLTAGYADGGLYLEGQQNSYPSILAGQFAQAGGAVFRQPLFEASQFNGSGYLKLTGFDAAGSPILEDVTTNLATTGEPGLPGGNVLTPYTGAIDNLGVPGISVRDLNNTTYGLLNPYYHRMLTAPERSTKSYLTFMRERAVGTTFFTCWLGNNDVLGYATSGGANPFTGYLTPAAMFQPLYDSAVNIMSRNGTIKGVCATVPNVTAVPFFKAVTVAQVNAQLAATAVPATLGAPTGSKFQLVVKALPPGGGAQITRMAVNADLLTLPAGSQINTTTAGNPLPSGVGLIGPDGTTIISSNPLASSYVLDTVEIRNVRQSTVVLNNIIRQTAAKYKVALADMTPFFDEINANGFATNAADNSTDYISGNLFSLDGVHPSPRGYAVVANKFIEVINANYGASLRPVDPNRYRAVRLP